MKRKGKGWEGRGGNRREKRRGREERGKETTGGGGGWCPHVTFLHDATPVKVTR